jgi:hypothetical protein
MKSTKASNTEIKQEIDEIVGSTHKTWHKFSGWLSRTFGKDLIEEKTFEIPLKNGKAKVIKYLSRHKKGFFYLSFNEMNT